MTAELVLPWPPTINTYWRSIPLRGRVRVLISKAGRDFSRNVGLICLSKGRPRFLYDRLAVHVTAYPPDARTRDLDNLLKPTLDALVKAGVMMDDGQVDELLIRRGPVEKPGRLHVTIHTLQKELHR